MATKREIEKYVNLPWSYTIEQEEGTYIVYVNELPGICSDAKTITIAMENIKEAIYAAIKLYLAQGKEIPIPINKSKYKGKIAYRTSIERHYLIAKIAHKQHKSLSKILDMLIDAGLNHNSLVHR